MSRTIFLHLDEARTALLDSLRAAWSNLNLEKVLVIEDAFGQFSLGIWGTRAAETALQEILAKISPYGASLFWLPQDGEFDPLELEASWEEAIPLPFNDESELDIIRLIVRHRMLPAWQQCRKEPLWSLSDSESCPIISFYSFKGGMGRTTALASFALDRARRDQHVVVVDLDLDAPGLKSVFSATSPSSFGVADYLLEFPLIGQPEDLLDYSCSVSLGAIHTAGSLRVFPAGKLDSHYLGKIARLDFEQTDDPSVHHPLEELLLQIRATYHPDCILLDSRTGFSETAGMLLSGLAHFHVLVGVDSTQSWEGLAYAVRKLGAERVRRGYPQAETMIVQGLVPDLKKEMKQKLLESFREKSTDLFATEYYAAEEENHDEAYWYLKDSAEEDSPHWPWPLSYSAALAQSVDMENLLDSLDSKQSGVPDFCTALANRILTEYKA